LIITIYKLNAFKCKEKNCKQKLLPHLTDIHSDKKNYCNSHIQYHHRESGEKERDQIEILSSKIYDYPKDFYPWALSVSFYSFNFIYFFVYADQIYPTLSQLFQKDKYACCIFYGLSQLFLNYYYKMIYAPKIYSADQEKTSMLFSLIRTAKSIACATIFSFNTTVEAVTYKRLAHMISVSVLILIELYHETHRVKQKRKKNIDYKGHWNISRIILKSTLGVLFFGIGAFGNNQYDSVKFSSFLVENLFLSSTIN